MISESDTKVGIVVCDGVECFTDDFVLGSLRKTFNSGGTRLDFAKFEKHARRNFQATYKLAKE